MKNITVLFFATIRDHMDAKEIKVQLPEDAGIPQLKQYLIGQKPEIEPVLDSALVAINREYAFSGAQIPDGAEVAFFPHVSGG
jgi:molybdopterin converting factor subunit 1